MAMSKSYYEREAEELRNEIAEVESLTEREMQERFNTDESKGEFLEFLHNELRIAETHVREREDDEDYDEWDDHGFASEADYMRYRFG